jgi:hypothetical protein
MLHRSQRDVLAPRAAGRVFFLDSYPYRTYQDVGVYMQVDGGDTATQCRFVTAEVTNRIASRLSGGETSRQVESLSARTVD